MKSRLIAIGVALLGYAIIDGQAANAADKFFDDHDGANSLWSNNANWALSCGGTESSQPTTGELATICADNVAVVDDANAVALRVTLEAGTNPSDTRIDIDPASAAAQLELGSGGTALTSTLNSNSEIRLMDDADGTNFATLSFVTQSHTVAGPGEIVGEDDIAEIKIDAVQLTLTGEINGHLIIRDGASAGTFQNNGIVIADAANGTLQMAATTMDDSSGAVRWRVETSGTAKLLFSVQPASLQGDVDVLEGTFRAGDDLSPGDDIDVCTTGVLKHTDGDIVAGTLDSFIRVSTCP